MVLDDLAGLIDDSGLAELSVNLFKSELPEEPDDCVALLEYEGGPPTFVQNDTAPEYEEPRVQVNVRGKRYQDARVRAGAIWLLLSRVSNEVVGDARYLKVIPLNSPFVLDRDDNRRTIVGFNIVARKALDG